jgi:hypothetical protein
MGLRFALLEDRRVDAEALLGEDAKDLVPDSLGIRGRMENSIEMDALLPQMPAQVEQRFPCASVIHRDCCQDEVLRRRLAETEIEIARLVSEDVTVRHSRSVLRSVPPPPGWSDRDYLTRQQCLSDGSHP